MNKQYIEVVYKGESIAVIHVCECSPQDFIKKQREANANFSRLVNGLLERIDNLEKEVKILKGEE